MRRTVSATASATPTLSYTPDPLDEFTLTIPVWPPSKSNSLRIVRVQGHAHLGTSSAVHAFEEQVAWAVKLATKGRPVLWSEPRDVVVKHRDGTVGVRRQRAKPLTPLFPAEVEVEVEVDLVEPYRSERDTDGTLKATLDALQHAGVYVNDRQVGDLLVRRPWAREFTPDECIRVHLARVPVPSWSRNPTGRPANTAVIRRWLKQRAVGKAAAL